MKNSRYDLKGERGFWRGKVIVMYLMITLTFHLLAINAYTFFQYNPNPVIDENEIRVKTNFSEPMFTEITIGGEKYSRVTIDGLMNGGNPGEPVLPVKTLKVLLPIDKEIDSTDIEYDTEIVINGTYLIEPGQRQVSLRDLSDYEGTKPDKRIYESSQAFHNVLYRFITLQKLSGYKIAIFHLYPVIYNPKEGMISYYESLTLVVHLRPTNEALDLTRYRPACNKGDIQIIDRIKGFVDNPDILSALSSYHRHRFLTTSTSYNLPGNLPETGPYEYIIITDQSFEDAFQPLIESKIKKGLTARIVTTQWIYENYDGTRPDGDVDEQTKIRNFISDAHNYWGTQYVLLGGDSDSDDLGYESGDVIVPCRILYDSVYGEYYPDEAHIASDLYYACLNGSFDYNRNGIYGETGDGEDGEEVDLLAEVFVGRAPVDSVEEVSNFVNKTLAHEDSIPPVWKNKMVGEDMSPWEGIARYAYSYLEETRLGSNEHGYSTTGIEASSIQSDVLYDSQDYEWKRQKLIASMNNSGTHYYNHLGHSNVNYNMKLTNADVDRLRNKEPFFVYSQGCYAASFDNMGLYHDINGIPTKPFRCDCIAEHFVNNSFGAFAYIGNTRYGWGVHDSTDGASQYFHRVFWDVVIDQGIRELGRANQKSKEDNIGFITYDDPMRWCYFQITLLGDPEISLGDFIFDTEKPSEPSNFVVSEGTYNNEAYLTWDHFHDATEYKIFRNEAYDSESASFITQLVYNSQLHNDSVHYIDNTGEPGKTYYYWVKACDGDKVSGFCRAHEVFINIPPVANAGNNQTKKVKSKSDKKEVTLDGSYSYDPEGGTLTYEWIMDGNIIATEAKTAVLLGVGEKTFTLRVYNGLKSNSDTVTIKVKVDKIDIYNITDAFSRGLFGSYYAGYYSIFPGAGYYGGFWDSSFGGYNRGYPGGYLGQGSFGYNNSGFMGSSLNPGFNRSPTPFSPLWR